MSDLVAVGRVVGVFGNKGSLRVSSLTDFPSRILELQSVYLVGEENEHQVLAVSRHRGGYTMTLAGVDTDEKARNLVGRYIGIPEEQLATLPEGTYYEFQIIGMVVCLENGREIGEVTEIIELPSNDVLVIDQQGQETLVPLVSQFVKNIDLDNRKITLTPIKGLIEQE